MRQQERVEEIRPDILPENDEKVELIKKRVSRHIDLKAILE